MPEIKTILGLDLGIASIGLSLREVDVRHFDKVFASVTTFSAPSTTTTQGVEVSNASTRTALRSARKRQHRRRLRKQEVLLELSRMLLAPISKPEVAAWMQSGRRRMYPHTPEFVAWLKLDFDQNGLPDYDNPYALRALALTHPAHVSRYAFGRICYHYCQRRGYRFGMDELEPEVTDTQEAPPARTAKAASRAKKNDAEETEVASNAAEVKQTRGQINDTLARMSAAGFQSPSTYLAYLLEQGVDNEGTPYRARLRKAVASGQQNRFERGTLREEFRTLAAGCAPHLGLSHADCQRLEEIIFRQRKLKSKKAEVGHCLLESGRKDPKSGRFIGKSRPRLHQSHPEHELLRAWQILGNLKWHPATGESTEQPLTLPQKTALLDVFFRKSNFKIGETLKPALAKILAMHPTQVVLNYDDEETLAGMPFLATCAKAIGSKEAIHTLRQLAWDRLRTSQANGEAPGKQKEKWNSAEPDLHQIWGWVYEARLSDDPQALTNLEGLLAKAHIPASEAKKLVASIKDDYAAFSLKATTNILFMMETYDLPFHTAVMLAKLPDLVGYDRWKTEGEAALPEILRHLDESEQRRRAVLIANEYLRLYNDEDELGRFAMEAYQLTSKEKEDIRRKARTSFALRDLTLAEQDSAIEEGIRLIAARLALGTLHQPAEWKSLPGYSIHSFAYYPTPTQAFTLREYVRERFKLPTSKLDLLYHHSDQVVFRSSELTPAGQKLLPSPQTNSLRNPTVVRALYQLRRLLNHLIRTGKIEPETTAVYIETTREFNTANQRAAIRTRQKREEEARAKAEKSIKDILVQYGRTEEVTDAMILRYQLWEEQEGICLYTGRCIELSEVVEGKSVDIEHSIPQSRYPDSSRANLTLSDTHFNRFVKGSVFAGDLPDFETAIRPRLDFLETKVATLTNRLRSLKARTRQATEKAAKDELIRRKLLTGWELDYWREKLRNLTQKQAEFKGRWPKRALPDTALINAYAIKYLKSIFGRVIGTKGTSTDLIRKAWGFAEKDRGFHLHHAEDALFQTLLHRSPGDPDPYQVIAQLRRGQGAYFEKYRHRLEIEGQDAPGREKEILRILAEQLPTGIPNPQVLQGQVRKALDKTLVVPARVHSPLRKTIRREKDPASGKGSKSRRMGDGIRLSLHKQTFYGAIQRPDEEGQWQWRYRESMLLSGLTAADVKSIVDDRIRKIVEADMGILGEKAFQARGYVEIPPNARRQEATEGNARPQRVYKVKIFSRVKNPEVVKAHTNPLGLSHQRNPHKHYLYAANDANFGMAIFLGAKKKEMEVISALQVAREGLTNVLEVLGKGRVLLHIAQPAKQYLFYEDHPDSIRWDDPQEIRQRLFTLRGIEEGRLLFTRADTGMDTKARAAHMDKHFTLPRGSSRFFLNPNLILLRGSDLTKLRFLPVDGKAVTLLPDGTIRPGHYKDWL
ncbi:type II CRISPR RNA-guided endonuclease Cas9 [Nostoc sp. NIES-2111]